jgi:hypothetical protein
MAENRLPRSNALPGAKDPANVMEWHIFKQSRGRRWNVNRMNVSGFQNKTRLVAATT